VQVKDPRYVPQQGDVAVAAKLSVYNLEGLVQDLNPVYFIRNQFENQVDDTLRAMGLYARFSKIIPAQNAAEIKIKQTDPKDDYIVLKAIVFPYINVLWLGVMVMVLGFFLSIVNRAGQKDVTVAVGSK
jgi:cytochrome c-type biogenesis protein CcmF